MEGDVIEGVQQLISDQIKKYHEEKIRRDLGEEPRRGTGMEKAAKQLNIPHALLMQYFELN